MFMTLARCWWSYVVRGAAAIGFGILTVISPGSSLATLLLLFGGFALVNGVFTLRLALHDRRLPHWRYLILEGLASAAAGVLTLLWPRMSPLVLLLVIAGWSMVTGISAVVTAARLRRHVRGEWLLALSGGLSIAFGLVLSLFTGAGGLELVLWNLFPGAGTPAVVVWLGVYAIAFGALLLALGLRLRVWGCGVERQVPTGGDLHAPT